MQSTLPLSQIKPGQNPRRYIDQDQIKALATSIQTCGLIQPLVVRQTQEDGQYSIIAGERRYWACKLAFGEDGSVPVHILDVDSDAAFEIATAENTSRVDMSPTEESDAAARVLLVNQGDKDSVCSVMGWSLKKLNSRLALQNLVPEVKDALDRRTILLGHAELLAAVPQDKQAKALASIIQNELSIAKTRDLLLQVSQKLSVAIFDKGDCTNCSYNSELQASLMESNVGSGHCTNKECYVLKTEQELDARREAMVQDYPMVQIVGRADGKVIIPLRVEDVGQSQYEACASCSEFGATVSKDVETLGEVKKEQCFNAACNATKVAVYIADERAKQIAAAAIDEGQADSASVDQSVGQTEGQNTESESDGQVARKSVAATPKATVARENQRLKDYRIKAWRVASKKEVFNSKTLAFAVISELAMRGNLDRCDKTLLRKNEKALFGTDSGSSIGPYCPQTTLARQEVNAQKQDQFLCLMAASAMETIDFGFIEVLAQVNQFDLMAHWKMDKAFFELLTKSELLAVAKDTGIDLALGDSFKGAGTKKRDELIELMLTAPIDWSTAMPSVMLVGGMERDNLAAVGEPAIEAADQTEDQVASQVSHETITD